MTSPLSLTFVQPASGASATHAPSGLQTHAQRLTDAAARTQALLDWGHLANTLTLPFFLTPQWMRCWLQQVPTDTPLWLLRVRRGDRDVALAFVTQGAARRLGPLPWAPTWHLQATGGALDTLCIEYNDMLVDPTVPDARRLLIEQWQRLGRGARELHLPNLAPPPAGQAWGNVLQPTQGRLTAQTEIKPSFSIDLQRVRDAGHDLLALRSANLRSQVRRSLRAYAAVGELQLEAAPDVATAQQWLNALAALHQQHWEGRGKPGAFALPQFVAFHQALIEQCGVDPTHSTHVQLLRLRAGTQDIAYLYSLVHQGRVHFYQSGLDYEVGGKQARPGYAAHVLAAEYNARLGHAVYDFLMGESRYKSDLATDRCEMHSVVLQTPGWRFAAERGLRQQRERQRARRQAAAQTAAQAQAAATLVTRVLDPRTLSAADIAAWQALEARTVEPNAYLSPHFVLPALRHLDPQAPVFLVTAEAPATATAATAAGEHRWLGVALLRAQRPQRSLPLPHLVSYGSRHSYLSHWLLDAEQPAVAAEALLRATRRRFPWAAALRIEQCPVDGPLAQAMSQSAAALGQSVVQAYHQERAVLVPAQAGEHTLRDRLGAKQHANQERCRRRLQEQGPLTWALLRGEVNAEAIEHFLALEHTGWKREAGSSLRSNAADEAFFVEMAQGFATDGRALFTELRLDGRPIASTANFVSGDTGFAFKVGWDDSLRKFGVGLLNEAELVSAAPQGCADLRLIDSGAQPASFIEALWSERRQIATLDIPLNRIGRHIVAWVHQLRQRRAAARPAQAQEP